MKLGLPQPRARRIKFKVASRAHQGKGGMREGKRWISSDRIAQVLSGLIEHRWIAGGTEPVAPYESRICHRIPAISWAALDQPWTQRAVQCRGDLLCNLVLKVGQAVDVEIAFPGEANTLPVVVEHFHREAP